MLIGSLEYQKTFLENALHRIDGSIASMAADLHIHPSTLRKWVKGEQQAPTIAIVAVLMFLKLRELNADFNLMEAPGFSSLIKENIAKQKDGADFVDFKKSITEIIKNDVADTGVYFLSRCIHEKSRATEVALFLKKDIKRNLNSKGIVGSTNLIKAYVSQYPDESMISIYNASHMGSVPEIVLSVALKHRLDCIDASYNLYIASLQSINSSLDDAQLTKLLSNFDRRSKNFSPQKFIQLLGEVKERVMQYNGKLQFSSSDAMSLLANQQSNFDYI